MSHITANPAALPCIEEIGSDQPPPLNTEVPSATISAVLPSTNFVLETEDPDSKEEVSLGPIMVPNLILCVNIWGKDEFLIAIKCMIDDGAQLVLIRPEIVANLGLHIKKLFKLIHVTLALNGENTNCLLGNYDSLQLSSSNNAWSSCSVRALIAAGLCSDILLGLLWLTHNNIVVNHNACTVIDKKSNIDLMNDLLALPHLNRIKLCPKNKIKLNKNCSFEHIKPVNIVTAISTAIEVLAAETKLDDLEVELKRELKDIFEPIPHIDHLPTTEMA